MQLSIILLTFNSQNTIEKCVQSIVANFEKELEKNEYEILIQDNASQDNTRQVLSKLKKKHPTLPLSIHTSEKNLGFAAGINKVSKKAKGDFLLILNPDTQIKNDLVKRMILFMREDEKTGVMGGRLTSTTGKVEKSAGNDFGILHVFLLALGLDKYTGMRKAPNTIQRVDWVSGGCMLIRKKLFVDLQGFDEQYFMYLEDADLGKRARGVGYRVIYFPDFAVIHTEHASSDKSFAIGQIYKGLMIYSRKFHAKSTHILVQFLLAAKARLLASLASRAGKKKLSYAYKNALKNV